MILDKTFVEEYNLAAKGAKAFGQPIENLSREELIAVLMAHVEAAESTNRALKKLLEMVSALGKK